MQKWFKKQRNVSVVDVVLVISPDSKRGEWPLGKVIETYPVKDGLVRVVKLLVGKSTLTRPITKSCPLECEGEDNEKIETKCCR